MKSFFPGTDEQDSLLPTNEQEHPPHDRFKTKSHMDMFIRKEHTVVLKWVHNFLEKEDVCREAASNSFSGTELFPLVECYSLDTPEECSEIISTA